MMIKPINASNKAIDEPINITFEFDKPSIFRTEDNTAPPISNLAISTKNLPISFLSSLSMALIKFSSKIIHCFL